MRSLHASAAVLAALAGSVPGSAAAPAADPRPVPAAGGELTGRMVESKFGLVRRVEPISGRHQFEGEGLRLVACAGMDVVLVNDRDVLLSRPVGVRQGDLLFPPDLVRHLGRDVRPGAPPPSAAKEPPLRLDRGTVVLDPGHGGDHTGGRGAGGLCEKTVTMDVCLRLRDELQKRGIRTILTRTSDVHLNPDVQEDLERRVAISNQAKPDLFLSIHVNWAKSRDARGFEVYVQRGEAGTSRGRESRRVAETIVAAFDRALDTPNRGLKEAGFYVIRNTRSPAVLVELEFVSNPRGERELSDPAHRQKLAELIGEATAKSMPSRTAAK